MSRRGGPVVGAWFVGFSLLAASPHANAELWLEGRAGAGVTAGHYEFEKEYAGVLSGEPGVAHDEGGPFGAAMAFGVAGGLGLFEKLGVGLSGRLELAPYFDNIRPRYSSLDMHLLAAIGPTAAFRPSRSFEVRVTPEWAFARFTGSTQAIGADDNVYEFESMSGPGLGVSLGHVSAPGWGFSMSTNVARLSSEHQTLSLLTVTLLASYSTW